MKKLLILIIPLFIGVALFTGFVYVASSQPSFSALQVTTTPQTEVFLDKNTLGKTPLYNERLTSGEHTLKLILQESSGSASFEEKITLRGGVLTVVDRIFKPTEAESEMTILSLESLRNKESVEIAVNSSPQGSEIKLDGQILGLTPLLTKDVSISDHQVTLSKEGYHSKTFRVAPKRGYRLTIFAKLAISELKEPQAITPSPQLKQTKPDGKTVRILNTPTGFLRVRSLPSTDATEITRVKPQDTFQFLEEKDDWYKIRLPNSTEGWVTSQYAKLEE